jgi:GAF domain-containing protein
MNPVKSTIATGPVDLAALADASRLRAVAGYNLFDRGLRRTLDAVCERTVHKLHQPIGLVTIVLDSAQLVIGKSGLEGWIAEAGGAPVEWSFCARAVLANQTYVVDDARVDPVQSANPLVTFEKVRAYAGVPLRSPSGETIGAHCVLNATPQHFSAADIDVLERAGREIMAELAKHTRDRHPH